MMQPGRQYSTGNGYRYGFNGKEQDNEVSGQGNQYDYGFRIYNSRLGKFLSVDPLTKSYPWYTPYQFAGNMPIWAIDLDGAEERIIGDSRYLYERVKQAGATHEEASNAQFAHNAAGATAAILGGGITLTPYLYPYLLSAGTGGAMWLSNPSNQHLVSQIAGFAIELVNPDPNGAPVNFPGEGDEIAKGIKVLFKQFKVPMREGIPKFILNTERLKYYFDKLDYKGYSKIDLEKHAASIGQPLEKLNDNLTRSKSMNELLAKWGVTDSKKGLEWLAEAFNIGLDSKEISREVAKDGTISILRMVSVINSKTNEVIGEIRIGYLYRDGDLNSIPEISTIIPKEHKKKE